MDWCIFLIKWQRLTATVKENQTVGDFWGEWDGTCPPMAVSVTPIGMSFPAASSSSDNFCAKYLKNNSETIQIKSLLLTS